MASQRARRLGVGLFITGTDTDAGKTLVTAGLLRGFRALGLRAGAVKAVQTGCPQRADGSLDSPDAAVYRQLSAPDAGCEIAVPYRFAPACSPHLAARDAGVRIEISRIVETVDGLRTRTDIVVVEGAGGVLVPLSDRETMLDLMVQTALPTVVVSPNRLGTINHTLLTLEALLRRDIEVAGVVFTRCAPSDARTEYLREDNTRTIARLSGVPVLAEIPYIEGIGRAEEPALEALDGALAGAVPRLAAPLTRRREGAPA